METLPAAIISALVGSIFGGAVTAIYGVSPVRREVTELRVHVANELGAIRADLARMTGKVDRRRAPRFNSDQGDDS